MFGTGQRAAGAVGASGAVTVPWNGPTGRTLPFACLEIAARVLSLSPAELHGCGPQLPCPAAGLGPRRRRQPGLCQVSAYSGFLHQFGVCCKLVSGRTLADMHHTTHARAVDSNLQHGWVAPNVNDTGTQQ